MPTPLTADQVFPNTTAVIWDWEQHVHLLHGHHTDPDRINALLAAALGWAADDPDRELLIPGATATTWTCFTPDPTPDDEIAFRFAPATANTPGAIPVTWAITYALGDATDGFVPDYATDPAAALEESEWLRRSGFLAAVQPAQAAA